MPDTTIVVQAPRLRRRVDSLAWTWSRRGLALAAAGTLVVIALLAQAVLPYHVFSFDDEPRPLGLAELLNDGFVLTPVLLGSAVCLALLWAQRGQADRYAPLVVVAMMLGLAGGFAGISATSFIASEGDLVLGPGSAMRFSIGALGLASAVALVALVRLIATRSPQRGRWIAAYVVVWGAFFGGLQQVWLVQADDGVQLTPGQELAELPAALVLPVRYDKPGSLDRRTARLQVQLTADGRLHEDGAELTPAALRAELLPAVRAAASHHEAPLVLLSVDRHARWDALVHTIDTGLPTDAGVVALDLAVHVAESRHPTWCRGAIGTGLGYAPAAASGEDPSEPIRVRARRAGDVFELGLDGEPFRAPDVFLASYRERLRGHTIVLAAPAEATWGDLAPVLGRLAYDYLLVEFAVED
ncbi:MAG: hypothetical protein H6828_02025 [Planctomycetes bacterium]|nr:hypothetical protein [Planctomycetota bacterium]